MKRKSKFIYKTAAGFLLRVLSAVMLMSCTAGKYLEEGQKYYAGSEIKFETKDRVGGKKRVEETLLSLVPQQPNTKVLGMRPGVWLYFRQRDATKKKAQKKLKPCND